MIDINELRRKLGSDDLIDHVDIHANVKPVITELIGRIEAAEKDRSNFIVEMGKLCAQCDALRAKIAEMEKQEPVARFNWSKGKIEWLRPWNYSTMNMKPLYLAPGAKGEEK